MFLGDPSSLSNLEYFSASHLEWQITVDFEKKILKCVAKQTFQCIKSISDNFVLVCIPLILMLQKILKTANILF